MATIMLMHWPEVTEEQYQSARQVVNWEGDFPKGAKFHTSWFASDGFHVLDLWDSREDFEAFVRDRLRPGVEKIGIKGQPAVQFETPASIFAPNPA
jgi:hypothetical protein